MRSFGTGLHMAGKRFTQIKTNATVVGKYSRFFVYLAIHHIKFDI